MVDLNPAPPPKPNIILNRLNYDDKSTIGEFLVLGTGFSCNTLEDTVRKVKKYGETAIPSGVYRVILAQHEHFGFVPQLLDVPFYDGILIHAGNSDIDTKGCILVGKYDSTQKDWIGQSRVTHEALMKVLVPLDQTGEMRVDVRGGFTADEMWGRVG